MSGENLLATGDQVKYVFVILHGLVMIFKGKNEYADYSLGPGDYFGDEAYAKNKKSTKTYQAMNDVSFCQVNKETFAKSELFASFRKTMGFEQSINMKQRAMSRSSTETTTSSTGEDNLSRGANGGTEPDEEGTCSTFFINNKSNKTASKKDSSIWCAFDFGNFTR